MSKSETAPAGHAGEPARPSGGDPQEVHAGHYRFKPRRRCRETPGAGVRNLLSIYQAFTNSSATPEVRTHFSGTRYGDLKKQVAEAVVAALEPVQAALPLKITADPGYIAGVLKRKAPSGSRPSPMTRSEKE